MFPLPTYWVYFTVRVTPQFWQVRSLILIVLKDKVLNFNKVTVSLYSYIYFHGMTAPSGPEPPHFRDFTITLRHITLGRAPLDEWSARRTHLYLTTYGTYKKQRYMIPKGFEPVIPAREWPQNHVSHRAATGTGAYSVVLWLKAVWERERALTEELASEEDTDLSQDRQRNEWMNE
jgi:hypothetical protein